MAPDDCQTATLPSRVGHDFGLSAPIVIDQARIDRGHLFMLTRPREIARRVERFLAARPLGPAAGVAMSGRTPTVVPSGEIR